MQRIIVTGASSGIGKAIVNVLLEKNYEVIGLARRFTEEDKKLHFHPISINLAALEKLPVFFRELKKQFHPIDGIICNAGKGIFGNLEELSLTDICDVLNLNFLSQVHLVKYFLPLLKQQEHADLIFIGSEAALAGKKRGSIYCASKFALRGFAQALREECASSSVRISIIQPGMVNTPFYESLSFQPGESELNSLSPEDVAAAVAMVLSLRRGAVCDEILLTPHKRVIHYK